MYCHLHDHFENLWKTESLDTCAACGLLHVCTCFHVSLGSNKRDSMGHVYCPDCGLIAVSTTLAPA